MTHLEPPPVDVWPPPETEPEPATPAVMRSAPSVRPVEPVTETQPTVSVPLPPARPLSLSESLRAIWVGVRPQRPPVPPLPPPPPPFKWPHEETEPEPEPERKEWDGLTTRKIDTVTILIDLACELRESMPDRPEPAPIPADFAERFAWAVDRYLEEWT